MNQKLFTLGAGLLLTATASAAGFSARSFPILLPESVTAQSQQSAGMQRAPLNPNKDKGTYIFGYTMSDFDGQDHFSSIYGQQPMYINKMATVINPNDPFDSEYYRLIGAYGGGWTGEKYYTYRMRYYSFGLTYVDNWIEVDPATGTWKELQEYFETGYGVNDKDAFPRGIFTNPNDKNHNIYCLADSKTGSITSAIWTVNPSTGAMTHVIKELPEFYFALAYDYDNQLYGLTWNYDPADPEGKVFGAKIDVLDPDDNYSVISSTPIKVDGKEYVAYYSQNIAFDYSTGDLWWSSCNADGEYSMIKIDPLTFETVRYGSIGVKESFGGMYIPFETGEKRTAPARVSDLNFTIDANGANKVTLTWTNPSTQWNRRTLSSLSQVLIYRDDATTPVATLDATGKVGQPMSWTDESTTKGIHTYHVYACREAGVKGVPAHIDAYVGRDVPGPVENLVATTTDGKTATISWTVPTRGDNDGWFDNTDLSYTVTRNPGNKVVGTTKSLSIVDNDIPEVTLYTYSVVASNADGAGSSASSEPLLVGTSLLVPYSTEFIDKIDADRFHAIDKNGDGIRFEYDFNLNLMRNTYIIRLDKRVNDDILVSPLMTLKKDQIYRVDYKLHYDGYGEIKRISTHPYRILVGKTDTAAGLSQVVADEPEYTVNGRAVTHDQSAYFTVPEDGEYYIGYELLTKDEEDMWVYIEGFSIVEAAAVDLQAKSVNSHLAISSIDDNVFNVEVYNNGSNSVADYKVKVAYLDDNGKPVVFAETTDVPEIASHATQTVEVVGRPGVVGSKRIVGVVELEGDGAPENDMSEPLVVSIDEVPALNLTVNNSATEAVSTNVPFGHYNPYHASQTIYTPEMTGLSRLLSGRNATITRMAWEYTGHANFNTTSLDVYLDQTDATGFDVENPNWISVISFPVASVSVPFVSGRGYVVVDLDDEFTFDPAKPLMVTVVKNDVMQSEYLAEFRVFDSSWYNESFHTQIVRSNGPIDPAKVVEAALSFPEAPVLHLSVKGLSGIEEIALPGKGAIVYNGVTKSVEAIDLDLAYVEVYNLSGALVARVNANGNSAPINCAAGIYLLKAVTADGNSVTIKACVK